MRRLVLGLNGHRQRLNGPQMQRPDFFGMHTLRLGMGPLQLRLRCPITAPCQGGQG